MLGVDCDFCAGVVSGFFSVESHIYEVIDCDFCSVVTSQLQSQCLLSFINL